ncbi:hypothetical protein FPRO04_13457 [Fusarium proliferatum]|nr:hypothetical protein FPRO04_13457 [Fusarium proliferatum]
MIAKMIAELTGQASAPHFVKPQREPFNRVGFQDLVVGLLMALHNWRAFRLLRSSGSSINLDAAVSPNDLDFGRIKRLLRLSPTEQPADTLLWDQVYEPVIEFAPPPRSIVSSVQMTPWCAMRAALRTHPSIAAAQVFFEQCVQGSDPLFEDGWKGWPRDANQDGVLSWFSDINNKLAAFSDSYN